MSAPNPQRWSAQELASAVAGELLGDPAAAVHDIEPIDRAQPGALTFVREAKYLALWPASRASAALVTRRVWQESGGTTEPGAGRALVLVDDADQAMLAILRALATKAPAPTGRHPAASVDPSASLGEGAALGPGAIVGANTTIGPRTILHPGAAVGPNVTIGADCVLHANCVVEHGCSLGDRVTLHAGVVIGADGFGYVPGPTGLQKLPHLGDVRIGSDVEIGANTTVDRAKMGSTLIGDGTKIDNLVQIAHNCRIGKHCIICGCAALSGSVELGDGVMLAGGVGIADNVKLGAGCKVGARSGVMHDIPPGEDWVGYPAEKASRYLRIAAAVRSLPDVMPQVRRLLKKSE